jgi:hypothetical protein
MRGAFRALPSPFADDARRAFEGGRRAFPFRGRIVAGISQQKPPAGVPASPSPTRETVALGEIGLVARWRRGMPGGDRYAGLVGDLFQRRAGEHRSVHLNPNERPRVGARQPRQAHDLAEENLAF